MKSDGAYIYYPESSNQIIVKFSEEFLRQNNVVKIHDTYDSLSSHRGFELSSTFPLRDISHAEILKIIRRNDIRFTGGTISYQENSWLITLNHFIDSQETKPEFIDIDIEVEKKCVNTTANWIHRLRPDSDSKLLSIEDLESLSRNPNHSSDSPTLIIRLGDIAKPGEIIELNCKKAEQEGSASCIFINKHSDTIALAPDACNPEAMLVRIEVDEEIVIPEYLNYFLSENLNDYVGTALEYVTKEDISSLPVVVPSIQAQRVICNYLSSLESFKRVIREKTRHFDQIKPLKENPSQLLGHALCLTEEASNQSTNNTDTLPAPIAQALSALETKDKTKRFLCSLYLIEVLIQFHVVCSSSFAVKILGSNKLEEAYRTFEKSKWTISLSTWKNIYERQVGEFAKLTKNSSGPQIQSALSAFGEESFFAFSGMFSAETVSTFGKLIDFRNEYFGHPSSTPDETKELHTNNVLREVDAYLKQTSTLWKWLAAGICKDVPTNESFELVANIESFSGSLRNATTISMIVPPGILARNSLVFYPRNNPNRETIVQSIPFTFVDRISSTVHGLYFFSRIDKEGKLVFQSYSELKESTKLFQLEDPRVALLSRRVFSSQLVIDPENIVTLKEKG